MKVLIDTNILIDYFAKRTGYYETARKILTLCINGELSAAIAANSILNVFYILRKEYTSEERREMLLQLSKVIDIVEIDTDKIISALNREDFKDFEDCIQDECAVFYEAEYIITRNVGDFTTSEVKAIFPTDFLELLKNKTEGSRERTD